MKKYLIILISLLLIAGVFTGCANKDIPNPPEQTGIENIDVCSGGGLKISITDGETIQDICEMIKSIRGEELGSTKGYSGWLYLITMCTKDGEKWDFLITGDDEYARDGMRYDPQGSVILDLLDVIEQAYIDNRIYEMPLECSPYKAVSDGIDNSIYISHNDAEQILNIFNDSEWIYEEDPYAYTDIQADFIFRVNSGAEIFYEASSGKIFDRDNNCYFYLSDDDKAFIDGVLKIGE